MEENFNIHLGKKLRMRRLSLGLTQTKVARQLMLHFNKFKNMKKVQTELVLIDLCNITVFKSSNYILFEDYKEFKDINSSEETNDDLNYSFKQNIFISIKNSER